MGHSLGTMQMFYGFAHDNDWFSQRVSTAVALAPCTRLANVPGPVERFWPVPSWLPGSNAVNVGKNVPYIYDWFIKAFERAGVTSLFSKTWSADVDKICDMKNKRKCAGL